MNDLELLSAYLDNQLAPKDRAQLESRLNQDSDLRQQLDDLRMIKTRLVTLPTVKPPRSFILKPEMIRSRPAFNWIPILNFSTAIAAILFAVVISVDLFQTSAFQKEAMQVAAPQVAMSAQDTQLTTVTPPREPAAVSANATASNNAAGGGAGVGATGAAELPKAANAVTPAQQALAPAVRTTEQDKTPTQISQAAAPAAKGTEPTLTPSPTLTVAPPTPTVTTAVIVSPAPAAAQEAAASPWRVPQLIFGIILIILITFSIFARTWK